MADTEIWKDIYYVNRKTGEVIDYRGLYQASNLGRIKSLERDVFFKRNNNSVGMVKHIDEQILKPRLSGRGNTKYYRVSLSKVGYPKRGLFVHLIVANLFVPNHDNKPQVDHIDGNCLNNVSKNLQWVTPYENANNPNSLAKRNATPVLQLTKDGLQIKKWRSAVEAGNTLGIRYDSIYKCLEGKLITYKDFIWKYAS